MLHKAGASRHFLHTTYLWWLFIYGIHTVLQQHIQIKLYQLLIYGNGTVFLLLVVIKNRSWLHRLCSSMIWLLTSFSVMKLCYRFWCAVELFIIIILRPLHSTHGTVKIFLKNLLKLKPVYQTGWKIVAVVKKVLVPRDFTLCLGMHKPNCAGDDTMLRSRQWSRHLIQLPTKILIITNCQPWYAINQA